jgi:GT2 family glycosyltransferase
VSGDPAVRVVVPAHNAAGTLGRTLDALAAQELGEPFEVFVVDDGSTDSTAEIARAHPVVRRVVSGAGGSPGAARNAGAAGATAPALAFTDADCVPSPGWLAAGLRGLRDADLVQGRVDPDPNAARHPWDRTVSVTAAWGLFESANLFVDRGWFERLGGFSDGIAAPGDRPPLAEDVFLGWAIRDAGGRTAFTPAARVEHAVVARRATAFVAESKRLRHFPEIARRAPGIRETFLRRRVFLPGPTASFEAAALGAAVALVVRSPLPLAAALPYVQRLHRTARQWPGYPTWRLLGVTVAADAVGAAALVRGSLEQRTLVL